MYILTLVEDVYKVVEKLRLQYGDYKLAMLYNSELNAPANWNLIISADWADRLGIPQATKVIAYELYESFQPGNRGAMSRITVLKTTDPFVRDMTQLMSQMYPVLPRRGGVPVSQITADGITGAGYVFYSQPEVPA